MNMKWFAIVAIFLFLGVSVAPNICANQSIEQDKALTKLHIPYLLLGLITIKDAEIKLIVKDIIHEILSNGGATSDEVQAVVDNSGSKWNTTYTLAEVVTTENTDSNLRFFPGALRYFSGWKFRAKGMIISYYPYHDLVQYGWHLQINDNNIDEVKGHILGYYGDVEAFKEQVPPADLYSFTLEGTALLVFLWVE